VKWYGLNCCTNGLQQPFRRESRVGEIKSGPKKRKFWTTPLDWLPKLGFTFNSYMLWIKQQTLWHSILQSASLICAVLVLLLNCYRQTSLWSCWMLTRRLRLVLLARTILIERNNGTCDADRFALRLAGSLFDLKNVRHCGVSITVCKLPPISNLSAETSCITKSAVCSLTVWRTDYLSITVLIERSNTFVSRRNQVNLDPFAFIIAADRILRSTHWRNGKWKAEESTAKSDSIAWSGKLLSSISISR